MHIQLTVKKDKNWTPQKFPAIISVILWPANFLDTEYYNNNNSGEEVLLCKNVLASTINV